MGVVSWLLAPFEFEFMVRGVIAVAIVGGACGALGTFVVLRGLAFMGDALAHAIFPGVVIAYLLKASLVLGGIVCGLATAVGIGLIARSRRVAEDAATGILFAGAFALGVVLISSTRTYSRDLASFLFGNVLAVTTTDLWMIGAVALLVVLSLVAIGKELVLVSFDREMAEAMGYPTFRLDLALLVLIALTIVVAIQAVGNILVVALLITPSATARLLTDRIGPMMGLGALLGGLAGIVGLYASYYANVAAGGSIVLTATICFVVVLVATSVARRRGGQALLVDG
jgi:manganese/iron transport system permease protein